MKKHLIITTILTCLVTGCTPALEGEAISFLDALQGLINGGIQNNNANQNANSNDNVNANGSTNSNANSNQNTNANSNANGNSNANSNANANSNSNGSVCPDGVLRLEARIRSGSAEARVEYRKGANDCERLRVRVDGYAAGPHDVTLDGVVVGQVAVGADGKGELEFEASKGEIPAGFPALSVGSTAEVGALGGAMSLDCSTVDDSCVGNSNSNSNSNQNDNGG
ncbi:MAG: hypothetical protein KDA32_02240 [Phycisphaerales bacterium]|nr:hypothetical protein [Phycisphaerales bacterium]